MIIVIRVVCFIVCWSLFVLLLDYKTVNQPINRTSFNYSTLLLTCSQFHLLPLPRLHGWRMGGRWGLVQVCNRDRTAPVWLSPWREWDRWTREPTRVSSSLLTERRSPQQHGRSKLTVRHVKSPDLAMRNTATCWLCPKSLTTVHIVHHLHTVLLTIIGTHKV